MSARLTFLFDANHLLWRCAYAGSREPVWGDRCVSRFLESVRVTLHEFMPTRALVIWDGGRSPRRVSAFPSYKANREERTDAALKEEAIAHITTALRQLNCVVVRLPGREADDVIHRLSANLGGGTVISDDRDFLQLVRSGVAVYRPTSGRYIAGPNFLEEAGIPLEKYLIMRSMTGDTADNIPGIPSIGEKTATRILTPIDVPPGGVLTPEPLFAYLGTLGKRSRAEEGVLAGYEIVSRNFDLMDLSRETWTVREEAILSRFSLQETAAAVSEEEVTSLLRGLGMRLALSRYPEWVLPFRRLQ